jgi:hypothetical protein
VNSIATSNRWRWPVLATITILYAFVASWAVHRWPITTQAPSQTLSLQVITGFIDFLFTGLVPVTVLTPAILLLAFLRAPARWMICSLGVGLIACGMGAWVGDKGPEEFSLFWSIVILLVLNLPFLVIWTAMIVAVTDWMRRKGNSQL